mmetsp:Transcript_50856/g.115595  ORF Transcript_50856/g.115595 Transcript_50856/m.115595 type:complete len:584 (-) Transcript_50856:55-1806(-)
MRVSIVLPVLAKAGYDESAASHRANLAISAYCGSPKYYPEYLQKWDCGPSCNAADSVTDITLVQNPDMGVYGFVAMDAGKCTVTFRGTSTDQGSTTDNQKELVDYLFGPCDGCKIHKGAYTGYESIRADIKAALTKLTCGGTLQINGHSLGGALASVCAYDLADDYTVENYNYGSFRVGNPAFRTAYQAKVPDTWRLTHHKDPIPQGYLQSSGYQHVGTEIFYSGDTTGGFKVCDGAEDSSCSDQYGGNWIIIGLDVACCTNDHLSYLQPLVSVPTDGESCTYVAVDLAVEHAFAATAAYCEPEAVEAWDCGPACDGVKGGVTDVQILNVEVDNIIPSPVKLVHNSATLRAFVGKMQHRCVLSIADLFDARTGVALLQAVTELVPFGGEDDCPGCEVHRVPYLAYKALKPKLLAALEKIGCNANATQTAQRRMTITGHGLGASVGALVALEMQDGDGYYPGSFGIEASFNFGMPRTGNAAFVEAYERRLSEDVFRVTHKEDPFVHLPHASKGYMHVPQELYFPGNATDTPDSYVRCPNNGEDTRCSQHAAPDYSKTADHEWYLYPMVPVPMTPASCKAPTRLI